VSGGEVFVIKPAPCTTKTKQYIFLAKSQRGLTARRGDSVRARASRRTIYAERASAVLLDEVTALEHKSLDDLHHTEGSISKAGTWAGQQAAMGGLLNEHTLWNGQPLYPTGCSFFLHMVAEGGS